MTNSLDRSDEATSTDEDHCLRADNITRSFSSVTVVDDVSLQLQRGTLHALIGPNGSGKTTLLRLLGNILQPTSGSITYTVSEHRRLVGYLPQQPGFRPSFTVRETLGFYASLVDDDAESLLSQVGLEDAADRHVDELSGGMTRLLGVAQAIAGDPPIVLLDEPGSGLDPQMQKTIINVAQSLTEDGTAVLYSTHDLQLTEQFADIVSIIDAGHLVSTGPSVDLLERYGGASLRDVFEATVTGSSDSVAVTGNTEQ